VISFTLTPGQKGDVRVAPSLIQALPTADYVLADTQGCSTLSSWLD